VRDLAAVAILAALAARERTGLGQHVVCAHFDSAGAMMMAVMNMNYLFTGTPPGHAGNAHESIFPYVGPPLRMSGTPLVTDRAPPLLAADTETVLRERRGLPAATVARLAAAGIIGLPR
jgi:crotonobetainyl-CoA:carnitine CoA-transferase CaiB-like acyl-CoA transferase